jgi:hypothetical protein
MTMHHRILPFLPILWQASVPAQNYTAHPIDNIASTTVHTIPFAGNVTGADEARSQFLFPAAFLPPVGSVITGLDVVPSATAATVYERFEIWLAQTTSATLSTTFANNLTAPVLVYSRSPGTISWQGGNWFTIPFAVPFAYDGVRNLVVEVRKKIDRPNNPPLVGVNHRLFIYPQRNDLPLPIMTYGHYGSAAVNAPTAVLVAPAPMLMRLQWGPVRTLIVNSTRNTTGNGNRSYFHLGATITVTGLGQPGEFFLCAIDFGLLPAHTSLPSILGGLWLPNPVLFGSGAVALSGRASSTQTVPNNTNLIGLRVFYQGGLLGSAMAFTNVVDAPIAAF